jgi:DNA mismatch endonuclease, patch repair protein
MDWLTPEQRSRNMSAIRSRGNRTTEKAIRFRLVRAGITGWTLHSDLPGRPDFVFHKQRVAVFVDGCYWHGCPKCYRPPTSNESYWSQKLFRNTSRDRAVTRLLRRSGWRVARFWEHDCKKNAQLIVAKIGRLLKLSSQPKKRSYGPTGTR